MLTPAIEVFEEASHGKAPGPHHGQGVPFHALSIVW